MRASLQRGGIALGLALGGAAALWPASAGAQLFPRPAPAASMVKHDAQAARPGDTQPSLRAAHKLIDDDELVEARKRARDESLNRARERLLAGQRWPQASRNHGGE